MVYYLEPDEEQCVTFDIPDTGMCLYVPKKKIKFLKESMGKTKAFWEKTINDRLSQKKVEKLIEDTYQYHVQDIEVNTVEEAFKMGIAEGILAAVHILTQDK